ASVKCAQTVGERVKRCGTEEPNNWHRRLLRPRRDRPRRRAANEPNDPAPVKIAHGVAPFALPPCTTWWDDGGFGQQSTAVGSLSEVGRQPFGTAVQSRPRPLLTLRTKPESDSDRAHIDQQRCFGRSQCPAPAMSGGLANGDTPWHLSLCVGR